MRSHFSPISDRFTLCGSAIAALVSLLTRRLVFRGSAVYVSMDGLALWPSAVAEGSLFSTSDPKLSTFRFVSLCRPIFCGGLHIRGRDMLHYPFRLLLLRLSLSRVVTLTRSLNFGTHSPGVATAELDRPPHLRLHVVAR